MDLNGIAVIRLASLNYNIFPKSPLTSSKFTAQDYWVKIRSVIVTSNLINLPPGSPPILPNMLVK